MRCDVHVVLLALAVTATVIGHLSDYSYFVSMVCELLHVAMDLMWLLFLRGGGYARLGPAYKVHVEEGESTTTCKPRYTYMYDRARGLGEIYMLIRAARTNMHKDVKGRSPPCR